MRSLRHFWWLSLLVGSALAQDVTGIVTPPGGSAGGGTVTPSNTVTLTNKTISGASNTITNLGQASLTGAVPISVYTTATGVADCIAGDVSPDVNALATAGNMNVMIPKGCNYTLSGSPAVTPTGVGIYCEDSRSSTVSVASPHTTNSYVGPYGHLHGCGIINEFCYASVTPVNTDKTCALMGALYNEGGTNQVIAVWGGNGLVLNIGPTYVSPDGSASVETDVPGISLNISSVGGDALYCGTTNTTSFGTSCLRLVTAGVADNGFYGLNGQATPSVIHRMIWIKDYANASNGSQGWGERIDRVGDSTGTEQSLEIDDADSISSLNTSNFINIGVNHQTSGNILSIAQGTTPFSGTFNVISAGAASGTFTGKFADYFNNGTEEFKVDASGNLLANGSVTGAGGSFTTLAVSSTVSGAGFTSLFASPPAIGGTLASTGAFSSLTFSGSFSTAASLANGIGLITSSPNYTDSSGTGGTIASAYFYALPSAQLRTTTNTTYSNVATLYVPAPTCGSGGGGTPTCTGLLGILTNGQIQAQAGAGFTGGSFIANNSGNFSSNIGTGSNTGTVTLGNTSGGEVTIAAATTKLSNLAASSAAQTGTVCSGTGGLLTVDTTTTCLLSAARFKQAVESLDVGLAELRQLRPVSYELRPEFDPYHLGRQVGFIAEDVEQIDKRLVGYGGDGQIHGVRYMQMAALLAAAGIEEDAIVHSLKVKVDRQQLEIYALVAWCALLTGLTAWPRGRKLFDKS